MTLQLPIDPVTPTVPHYQFSTELEGVQYLLELRWNARAAAWFLHVMDEEGDPIRMGIKVVLGVPLGRRCADPRYPPGALVAVDTSGAGRDAGLDDLGSRVAIYYYSLAEIQEAFA